MEILVCVKRVPDTAENEIEVNSDGSDIERDDLVYSVNEWDNYAVEEAILNALTAAETMTGYKGNTAYALPLEALAAIMAAKRP